MRIVHRVGKNIDAASQAEFQRIGVTIGLGLQVFEMFEDDPRWPSVKDFISHSGGVDTARPEFNILELEHAPFLVVKAKMWWGFPQPEGHFQSHTYDPSSGCFACGVGFSQSSPFRLKRSPNWGNGRCFQLHWVAEELFIRTDSYGDSFGHIAPGAPVLEHRTGSPLPDVVQLPLREEIDVNTGKLACSICDVCKEPKWAGQILGFSPSPTVRTTPSVFRSTQYFGYGQAADRLIYITAEMYRHLLSIGFANQLQFFPCSNE